MNTELNRPKSPASVGGECQRAAKASMDSTNIQGGVNLPLNEVSFKEVGFYTVSPDSDRLICLLCPRSCIIEPGKFGRCRVRRNEAGKLISLNYGICTSIAFDPVEKKPLYHFYPGWNVLSLGSFGCNLSCGFCQNWELSQGTPPGQFLSPEDLVKILQVRGKESNCCGVAYTYSEPSVWYEFVSDASPLVKENGFKNILVTNGMLNRAPLKQLLPQLDALNIDLKGFTEDFYREVVGGSLQRVMDTVELSLEMGKHVEVTTLIIPGLNDSREELKQLAQWLSGLSVDLPLHLSRYFPRYKFNQPPTPEETLLEAREIAREYLNYVYIGNLDSRGYSDTECLRCGQRLIERTGYLIKMTGLDKGVCTRCGYRPPIVGLE